MNLANAISLLDIVLDDMRIPDNSFCKLVEIRDILIALANQKEIE